MSHFTPKSNTLIENKICIFQKMNFKHESILSFSATSLLCFLFNIEFVIWHKKQHIFSKDVNDFDSIAKRIKAGRVLVSTF